MHNIKTEIHNMTCSSWMKRLSREWDKLRLDISEANKQTALLAHAIDEHHTWDGQARQDQLRQLETKHTEAL